MAQFTQSSKGGTKIQETFFSRRAGTNAQSFLSPTVSCFSVSLPVGESRNSYLDPNRCFFLNSSLTNVIPLTLASVQRKEKKKKGKEKERKEKKRREKKRIE